MRSDRQLEARPPNVGVRAFGLNVVDIAPGDQIPEHDEIARDQEEVFFILSGTPTLVVDGEDHPARAGSFARLDPEHTRTARWHSAGAWRRVRPGIARRRSLTSQLYRAARISNNISAIASGNPRRIARRAKNVTVGRALGRGGFWRWLWK